MSTGTIRSKPSTGTLGSSRGRRSAPYSGTASAHCRRMRDMQTLTSDLAAELRARAKKLGFDAFGIAAADARPDLKQKLDAALKHGWQDGMGWMHDDPDRRSSPGALWDGARSVIMLGMNYGPDRD